MIKTAVFVKGIVGPDSALDAPFPQVAIIGRSNVGKSTLINTLTKQKNLARTSHFPGRTQEINLFLLNNNTYLLDLPGYGFAKLSQENKNLVSQRIAWYLFDSPRPRSVLLLIDAVVGPTVDDAEMLTALRHAGHHVVIIANKIDKLKKAQLQPQLRKITETLGSEILPVSSVTKIGISRLQALLVSSVGAS